MTSRPTTSRSKSRAAAKRFVRPRKTYVLRFDDPDLEGLEIRAASVSLGKFLELLKLASVLDGDDTMDAAAAEAIGGLFTGFADALISWNLDERHDDEIVEVPATLEGVLAQDTDFMLQVIMAWLDVMGDVDVPLDRTSNGGKPSAAPPLPVAVLSPNPAS